MHFSRVGDIFHTFAWLTHNLWEMSLTLKVKIRYHADHPRRSPTQITHARAHGLHQHVSHINIYRPDGAKFCNRGHKLILINYFRLLSDVTNFFLILCFANDNIDKIKSNHNLNIFINIIFIIIFFVFLFQISLWLSIYVLWFWDNWVII